MPGSSLTALSCLHDSCDTIGWLAAQILVAGLIPYLALPIDLIPDFVPVAGRLDDAALVAFVLRRVVRANPSLVQEHWPGPSSSLALLLRLVGGSDRVRCPVTVTFVVVSGS